MILDRVARKVRRHDLDRIPTRQGVQQLVDNREPYNELLGGDCPASYLLPILFQHQLIYPVGVKHLMHQHVPEHYIHRVVAERLVLGGPLPILCG